MTVKIVLAYKGKQYTVKDIYAANVEDADYMWTLGNYSCDDNRSIFIQDQCDPDFPYLDCGDTIELVKMEDSNEL
jgi:hypothetical protein